MTISTVYLLVKKIDFKFNLKNGQKYMDCIILILLEMQFFNLQNAA